MRGSYCIANPGKKPLRITHSNSRLSRDVQPQAKDLRDFNGAQREENNAAQSTYKGIEQKQGSAHLLPNLDLDKENRGLKRPSSKSQPYRIRGLSHSEYDSKGKLKNDMKSDIINEKAFLQQRGTLQLKERDQRVQVTVSDLIDKLSSNFYLSIKSGVISIKRNKFQSIFKQLMEHLSTDFHSAYLHEESVLSPFFGQLGQIIKKSQHLSKSQKIRRSRPCINLTVDPADYHARKNALSISLVSLQSQKVELESKILRLRGEEKDLCEACASAKQELEGTTKKLRELKANLQKQTSIYENTLSLILEGQTRLNKIDEEADRILNYVTVQQGMPVLHSVRESFKHIEEEIYSYAEQLKHNELYCSLTFEPKPFSVVEGYIKDDMERLNHFLMSKDKELEQKTKRMTQFVLSSMRKFKNKDEQMGKVSRMKTECCLKFVDMMQKWMENWQLKQDFLVNLRKEFAVKADSINSIFKKLVPDGAPQPAWQDSDQLLRKLLKEWKSVQENYKLGNSFY